MCQLQPEEEGWFADSTESQGFAHTGYPEGAEFSVHAASVDLLEGSIPGSRAENKACVVGEEDPGSWSPTGYSSPRNWDCFHM